MSRLVLLGALAALFAAFAVSGTTRAAPLPSTSLMLVCDRSVNAQVTAQLFTSAGGTLLGTPTLSCGPDSVSGSRRDTVKFTTASPAGFVNVQTFAVQSNTSGGCGTAGSLPLKFECIPAGATSGATLTVR